MKKFVQIYCREETAAGRLCRTYLGNVELGARGCVHFPCRNASRHKHAQHKLSEWEQSPSGTILYRPVTAPLEYFDDETRISDGR
jgi:hypothetical protein